MPGVAGQPASFPVVCSSPVLPEGAARTLNVQMGLLGQRRE